MRGVMRGLIPTELPEIEAGGGIISGVGTHPIIQHVEEDQGHGGPEEDGIPRQVHDVRHDHELGK